MKSEDRFNAFNSFGLIDFIMVFFPLCLLWAFIFLQKNLLI